MSGPTPQMTGSAPSTRPATRATSSTRDRPDGGHLLVDRDDSAPSGHLAAQPSHPPRGVLQAEQERALQVAGGDLELALGDAGGGERLGLGHDQLAHLGGAGRTGAGVRGEHPGIGVERRRRVHRVRQATLLTDLLEQAARQPAAEDLVQDGEGEAVRVVEVERRPGHDEVALLGRPPDQRPRDRTSRSGACRAGRSTVDAEDPNRAPTASSTWSCSTAPAAATTRFVAR